MPSVCKTCGASVHFMAFLLDAEGNFVRDDNGKAIVHKHSAEEREAAAQSRDYSGQEPTMPFGKYRGKTVRELAKMQPDYLRWALTKSTAPWLVEAITNALAEVGGGQTQNVETLGGGDGDWD